MADLDLDRLMADADAVTVANAIGMQVFKRGNHYFSYCPIHREKTGAEDTHPTNFVLRDKGGYCFSCGEFVSIPKMVTSFLGCKKCEAFDLIADAMGGRAFYASADTTDHSSQVRTPLTQEETELLGLDSQNITRVRDGEDPIYDGLGVLYRENPEAYKKIIRDRAEAKRHSLEYVLANYASLDAPKAHEVYALIGKEKFDQKIFSEIHRVVTARIEALDQVIAKV